APLARPLLPPPAPLIISCGCPLSRSAHVWRGTPQTTPAAPPQESDDGAAVRATAVPLGSRPRRGPRRPGHRTLFRPPRVRRRGRTTPLRLARHPRRHRPAPPRHG